MVPDNISKYIQSAIEKINKEGIPELERNQILNKLSSK